MINKKLFRDGAYEYAGEHSSVKDYKRILMDAESEAFISGVEYVREKLLELSKSLSREEFDFSHIDSIIFGNMDINYDYLNKEWIENNFFIDRIKNGRNINIPFKMSEFQEKIFNSYRENSGTIVLPIRQCGTSRILSIIGICEVFNGKKVLYLSDSFDGARFSVIWYNYKKDSPIECIKHNQSMIEFANGGLIRFGSGNNIENLLCSINYDLIILDNFLFYDNPEEVYQYVIGNTDSKVIISSVYPGIDRGEDECKLFETLYDTKGSIKGCIGDTFGNVDSIKEFCSNEEDFKKILCIYEK